MTGQNSATEFTERPDLSIPEQRVVFGTSGHRGSSLEVGFTEGHILAIIQAICLYRKVHGIDGPLLLGWDTHALSEPARVTIQEEAHAIIQRAFTAQAQG